MQLNAIGCANLAGGGKSRPATWASVWVCNSYIPFWPAPETDWYVLTITRRMRKASWSGLSATTIWMVEQFGLAMMPQCLATSCGLTSGTTKGTSGSIRKALELSTTTAPALAAIGLNWREIDAGVLDRTISTPANASGVSGSIGYVAPAYVTALPALRSDARNLIEPTGNFRSWSRRIITPPTAPLAPTTATLFTAIFLSSPGGVRAEPTR